MIKNTCISLFLISVYALILIHDFMPHHHHNGHYYVEVGFKDTHKHTYHDHVHDHGHDIFAMHHHEADDCGHPDCETSLPCNVPSHIHGADSNAEFLVSNIKIDFSSPLVAVLATVFNLEVLEENNLNEYSTFIPSIYKGPDISSCSLRGPPLV